MSATREQIEAAVLARLETQATPDYFWPRWAAAYEASVAASELMTALDAVPVRSSESVSLDDLVREPWQRCAGCGHDERHHPSPLGIATTPCAWRGCGCPWFVFPTPTEMAEMARGGARIDGDRRTDRSGTRGRGDGQ